MVNAKGTRRPTPRRPVQGAIDIYLLSPVKGVREITASQFREQEAVSEGVSAYVEQVELWADRGTVLGGARTGQDWA